MTRADENIQLSGGEPVPGLRALVATLVSAAIAGLVWYVLASGSSSHSLGRREAAADAIVVLEAENTAASQTGGSARRAYLARTLVIDTASTAISDDGRFAAQSDGLGTITIRDLDDPDARPLLARKPGATGLRWLLTADPNRNRVLSYTSSLGSLHLQTLSWDAPRRWTAAEDRRLVEGVAGTLPWVVEPLSPSRIVIAGQTKQSDGTVANVMQVLDVNGMNVVASAKGASPVLALTAVSSDRWLAGTAEGRVLDLRSNTLSGQYDAAPTQGPAADAPIASLAASRDRTNMFALDQSGVVYSAALSRSDLTGWKVIARAAKLQDFAGAAK